jgi:ketosteroid isomerase-like protein
MGQLAERFIQALGRLESESDVEAVAGMFAQDASLRSPLVTLKQGGDSAASFWSHYRSSFDEVRSDFDTIVEEDGAVFLEWQSKGSVQGQSFSYRGVSVLKGDGERISSFHTYFNPADLPTAKASDASGAQSQSQSQGQNQGRSLDGVETEDLDTAQREAAEQRAEGGYS